MQNGNEEGGRLIWHQIASFHLRFVKERHPGQSSISFFWMLRNSARNIKMHYTGFDRKFVFFVVCSELGISWNDFFLSENGKISRPFSYWNMIVNSWELQGHYRPWINPRIAWQYEMQFQLWFRVKSLARAHCRISFIGLNWILYFFSFTKRQ